MVVYKCIGIGHRGLGIGYNVHLQKREPRMETHPEFSVQVHHLSYLQIALQSGTHDVSLRRLQLFKYIILPRIIPDVKHYFLFPRTSM